MSPFAPSMNFFRQWIESLENDEEIQFHYQDNSSSPFFSHGRSRDYQYVVQIGEHKIMVYCNPFQSFPDGSTPIVFQGGEYPGAIDSPISIGYTEPNGIHVVADPRYMRYVAETEDRLSWTTAEDVEGRPPANQVFLEAIGAENFFRRWKPPTIEDIMQHTWLRKRESGIAMARRELQRASDNIQSLEQQLEAFRVKVLTARASLSEWGHATLEKFMETSFSYRHLLEGIGTDLHVNNNSITMTMNEFVIQGITLGPFIIEYTMSESSVKVFEAGDCGRSRNGNWHPHVSTDGSICWGESAGLLQRSLGNPFEALFLTVDFLRTGYHASGAYSRLDSWLEVDTYYCEYCDEQHRDTSPCPNECGECNENVDWDHHKMCNTHFVCYDDDNNNDNECHVCKSEREEEKQRKEEERRKAEEDDGAVVTKKKKKKKKKVKKKISKRQSRRSIPVSEAAE